MGLPHPPREWVRLRRVYLDARRAEAQEPSSVGRGRELRALVFAVTQVLAGVVVSGVLGLAVLMAAVVVDEHPLLARVAQAGSA